MPNETQTLEKLDLRVGQIMTPNPLTIDLNSDVEKAARGMEKCDCGCCLVESRGKIVGIITERDIVRRVAAKGSSLRKTKVKSMMSTPIVVVAPDATIEEALKAMADNKIKRLAVVDDKGLRGIISITDIAKALAEKTGYTSSLLNALARESRPPEGLYV